LRKGWFLSAQNNSPTDVFLLFFLSELAEREFGQRVAALNLHRRCEMREKDLIIAFLLLVVLGWAIISWISSDVNDFCGNDIACHTKMEAPQ